MRILESDTIEEFVIQEASYYARIRIAVINKDWSDTTKEHYYFEAYFPAHINKKEVREFSNNINTAVKEMCESRLENVKASLPGGKK